MDVTEMETSHQDAELCDIEQRLSVTMDITEIDEKVNLACREMEISEEDKMVSPCPVICNLHRLKD